MKPLCPDLPTTLDALLTQSLRLDPYLAWAMLTGFRDYRATNGPLFLSVAVELMTAGDEPEVCEDASIFSRLNPSLGRFRTYHVSLAGLFQLLWSPKVRRVELGSAVVPVEGTFQFVIQSIKEDVAVAVIDDFIAFEHDCFVSAMETRFKAVWSQDRLKPDSVDPNAWQAKLGLPYGYEWPPDRGNPSGKQEPAVAPAAYPRVLARRSHGTMVAYLAAGNDDQMAADSTAALIGVHLPRATLVDTSGGSLNVQALDALFYVLAACGPETRVVVNLSYATMAGPHDGTSILEAAMDEQIEIRQGKLAVVLPAGNSYAQKAHASFKLDAGNPTVVLRWFVPPSLRRPSFLEIWLPEGGLGFELEVRAPDQTVALKTRQDSEIDVAGDPVVAAIVRLPRVANGDNGTMVLVALAPTAAIDGLGATCAAGVWTVTFRLTDLEHTIPIRAWVERSDSLPDFPTSGTQSYFVDPAYDDEGSRPGDPNDSCSVVQRRGAFNTIACGDYTIVGGGYRGQYTPQVRQYAKGTGSGPLRCTSRRGPDFAACTEESLALPSLRVVGNRPGDAVRGAGTSLAAPQLTRLVADMMRSGPMLPSAIRAELARLKVPDVPPAPADCEREGAGRLSSVLDSGSAEFNRPYP